MYFKKDISFGVDIMDMYLIEDRRTPERHALTRLHITVRSAPSKQLSSSVPAAVQSGRIRLQRPSTTRWRGGASIPSAFRMRNTATFVSKRDRMSRRERFYVVENVQTVLAFDDMPESHTASRSSAAPAHISRTRNGS